MAFSGFGEYAVEFYDWLQADNSKAFWADYQHVYARDVRAPMEELLAELSDEFAGGFGDNTGRGKVFRPYRDLRFSNDKTPYKQHCGAVVEPGRGAGAYYVQVSSDGMMIGGGSFRMAPDQLARYRGAVDDERRGEELRRLVDDLCGRGWRLGGDVMRSRPRGFPADHPRIDLLRHRSLHVTHSWPPDDTLHERGALDRVRAGWRELAGLNEWVADHIGLAE